MFLRLRPVVYKAGDLDRAREWYAEVLGVIRTRTSSSGPSGDDVSLTTIC
jgi:catechol 2,3-dioxygenase-like lactoylglutathione lyase family enzyme